MCWEGFPRPWLNTATAYSDLGSLTWLSADSLGHREVLMGQWGHKAIYIEITW